MARELKPKKAKRQEEQPSVEWRKKVLSFLKEAGIVIGAWLFLNSFVIASFVVPTGSMEDEVMTGDFLFVNKWIYGGTTPRNIPFTDIRLPWFRVPKLRDVERGDVIVFEFPGMREQVRDDLVQFYLKRCVALPGDTLQIRNRVLFVNGQMAPIPRNMKFDEPYRPISTEPKDYIFPPTAPWNEENYGPIIIPFKGMVIDLTPDNYLRWEMFIKREGHSPRMIGGRIYIDDKAVTSYTAEQDYLFGMGDHRDNSLDSRFWGFIPKENLMGTPLIVYWSWDTGLPIYDIFGKIASVRFNRLGKVIR